MERALEALSVGADGCPTFRMVDIGAQEELQLLAALHLTVNRMMAFEIARSNDAVLIGYYLISIIRFACMQQTQVKQLFEDVKSVLATGAVVIDVDLRVALSVCFGNVHIVVMFLGIHHCLHVVVVGHAHGHGIRIGTTQVGLGVVGHVVAVLIPVERIGCRVVFHTVGVAFGICLVLEELPTAAGHFIGAGGHFRLAHGVEPSGQDKVRRQDVLHNRHTALKLQVNVQHVTLADGRYIAAGVSLLVVVLIDHGDNLLLRQVVDIALACDEERRGLRR